LLIIELKDLRREARAAAQFLHSRMQVPVQLQGGQLRLRDMPARGVKILLRKFLHQKGLGSYRVRVVHSGLVEVFAPEHTRPTGTGRVRGSAPSPGATMPYAFPFSPSLPGSKVRKLRTKRG